MQVESESGRALNRFTRLTVMEQIEGVRLGDGSGLATDDECYSL